MSNVLTARDLEEIIAKGGDPNAVAKDAILQHKAPYLNVSFFLARAAGVDAVGVSSANVPWGVSVRTRTYSTSASTQLRRTSSSQRPTTSR